MKGKDSTKITIIIIAILLVVVVLTWIFVVNPEARKPRTLSDTGREIKGLVDNDAWFMLPGKNKKEFPEEGKILVKISTAYENLVYTDVIVWKYTTNTSSNSGNKSVAAAQINILYNTTITYDVITKEWSDSGNDSGQITLKNVTIGMKLTGDYNNDFICGIEQEGAYHPAYEPNISKETTEKIAYRAFSTPYKVTDGIDKISDFDKLSTGSTKITFSDTSMTHYSQNNGYVKSTLMNSYENILYKTTDMQKQTISISKMPDTQGSREIVYQSHYEVYGLEGAGRLLLLWEDEVMYSQNYS